MPFFESNKDMGMFALITLVIIALYFVYKDTKKTKDEFDILSRKVSNLAMVNDVPRPPPTVPVVAPKPEPVVEAQKEE